MAAASPVPGLVRIVVTGDANSGKTSLMNRICRDLFQETYSTVGFEYNTVVHEGTKLQFWDSSGGERFRALVPMYYRRIDQVWIVLNSKADWREQATYWVKHAQTNTDGAIPILLILNKVDDPAGTSIKFELRDFNLPCVAGSAMCDTQESWLKKVALFFPRSAPPRTSVDLDQPAFYSCCTST